MLTSWIHQLDSLFHQTKKTVEENWSSFTALNGDDRHKDKNKEIN